MKQVKLNESNKISSQQRLIKTSSKNYRKSHPGLISHSIIEGILFFWMLNPSSVWKVVNNNFTMLLNNHAIGIDIKIQALTGST